jgi:uncharacterized damage-inducible protein DinB
VAIKDALLPEFDHEMGVTRRLLERVPEADFGWKPHEKSFSLGALVAHLAQIPEWSAMILDQPSFNLESSAEHTRPGPTSRAQLLAAFDEAVARARGRVAVKSDGELMAVWTFQKDGQTVFTVPAVAAFKSFIVNHSIHHRGQLSVYLRLRNVPLPAMYGPSADEAM